MCVYLTTLPVEVSRMMVPAASAAISIVNVHDAAPAVELFVTDLVALSCVHVDASLVVSVPTVAVNLTQYDDPIPVDVGRYQLALPGVVESLMAPSPEIVPSVTTPNVAVARFPAVLSPHTSHAVKLETTPAPPAMNICCTALKSSHSR